MENAVFESLAPIDLSSQGTVTLGGLNQGF